MGRPPPSTPAGTSAAGILLSVAARAAVLDSPHQDPVALSAGYLGAPAAGRCLTVQATTATLCEDAPAWSSPTPPATPVEECFSDAEHAHLAPPGVRVPGLSLWVETPLGPATAGWAQGQLSGEPVMRAWSASPTGASPIRCRWSPSATACRRPAGGCRPGLVPGRVAGR